MRDGCPFCDYDGPSEVLAHGSPWFVIEPLNPITSGHLLVVSERHIEDFRTEPYVLGELMEVAAAVAGERYGGDACNLIVSAGAAATQTVMHLHVHVVPRREGDGLLLPWSAPDARAGFAQAIDLIDAYLKFPDEVMKPVREAYRQITPSKFGERRGEPT